MLKHRFGEQTMAKGARSTALHSLQWVLFILLGAITAGSYSGAKPWMLMVLAGLVIAVSAVLLFAFLYLLLRQPEALRSEEYILTKLAIEKGIVGDSLHGTTVFQGVPTKGDVQTVDFSDRAEQGL